MSIVSFSFLPLICDLAGDSSVDDDEDVGIEGIVDRAGHGDVAAVWG